MADREQPSHRSRTFRDSSSPPIRDQRASSGTSEAKAPTLYTLLVGTCLFVVGVAGLVGEPDVPGGATGELLRDLVAVDPARDVLHTGIGLIGVAAGLACRQNTYCRAATIVFMTLSVSGFILEIWGAGSAQGLPSTSLIANWVYLVLGALALWCVRSRQSTDRNTVGY